MARTRDRIIALTIAILFFGVSFALSFAVIWELYKNNKEAKTVNGPGSNNSQSSDIQTTKLKGTKLANFTPGAKIDTLQKVDTQEGTGAEVKPQDKVTVNYTGALAADGTIFESSLDSGQPVSFALNEVIQGWGEGIPGMKEGGTRRLLIPAALAYGENPRDPSVIPPNSDLVFDVTLIKIGE
jgi:FKBP-type peptidyl-prolyl cis-trans isomerase FkpA